MKLTIDSYIEPLTIEVTKGGEVIETIELELDFSDSNVIKMAEMAKEVVKAASGIKEGSPASDVSKAAEKTVAKIEPAIDLFAGEGATKRIAEAFGKAYEPIDCLHGIIEIWGSLNEECVRRSSQSRVKATSKYLDAQA